MLKAAMYKSEGYPLVGAAFKVQNDRSHGRVEEIHQECLEIELVLRETAFLASAGLNRASCLAEGCPR